MSSNFLETAIQKYPTRKHVLDPDVIPFINSMKTIGENGGEVYIHKQANTTEVSADALVSIQPMTSTPSTLNGAVVDFRPDNGIVSRWDYAFLKLNITNSTGASCTLVPSQFLLQYIQVFGANGNVLLLQMYGTELWL